MKKKIRKFLDIDELAEHQQGMKEDLREFRKRQSAIAEELQDLKEDIVLEEDLEEKIQSLQEELEHEPEKADFSPNEKKIISVFLHSEEEELTTSDISEQLEKSKGTVRKYMSMLTEKIDFSVRKEGRSKKYRLPDETEEDLLQGREISISN